MNRSIRKLSGAVAMLLAWAGLSVTSLQAAGLREFKSWVVSCDNTQRCRAVGLPKEKEKRNGALLILDREGGPRGNMTLQWRADGDLSAFHVDGVRIADVPSSAVVKLPRDDLREEEETGIVDAILVRRIVVAALNGSVLSHQPKADPENSVSLDGIRAALLFMDEQQGRIGNETALVRKGPKAASVIPEAPLPPRRGLPAGGAKDDPAIARMAQAVADFHRRNADKELCDRIEEVKADSIGGIRVDARTLLFEVSCWRAAYQAGSSYYVAREGVPASLAKARFEWLDTKTGALSIRTDIAPTQGGIDDERPGEIGYFHKGRGVADCYESGAWRWNGTLFRLSRFEVQPVCGSPLGERDRFILFRSREK
jgi:hypothetical protein